MKRASIAMPIWIPQGLTLVCYTLSLPWIKWKKGLSTDTISPVLINCLKFNSRSSMQGKLPWWRSNQEDMATEIWKRSDAVHWVQFQKSNITSTLIKEKNQKADPMIFLSWADQKIKKKQWTCPQSKTTKRKMFIWVITTDQREILIYIEHYWSPVIISSH